MVPRTPEIAAVIASSGGFAWGDYKLQLLAEMDRCLEDRVASRGAIDIAITFEIGENEATALSAEIKNSSLSAGDNVIVSACLRLAAQSLALIEENDQTSENIKEIHTRIQFPLTEDVIYKIVATNGAM